MVDSGETADVMTYFYCTGFGKFGNVLTNPTTKLVETLPNILKSIPENDKFFKLKHSEIVTVAMQDCDAAIQRIYNMVHENHGDADRHIIVNFGVAAGRDKFTLEVKGKNYMHFTCPDERGAAP